MTLAPTLVDWDTYGFTVSRGGMNPYETTLNPGNVRSDIGGPVYNAPSVVNGVVSVPSWDGRIHAFRLT